MLSFLIIDCSHHRPRHRKEEVLRRCHSFLCAGVCVCACIRPCSAVCFPAWCFFPESLWSVSEIGKLLQTANQQLSHNNHNFLTHYLLHYDLSLTFYLIFIIYFCFNLMFTKLNSDKYQNNQSKTIRAGIFGLRHIRKQALNPGFSFSPQILWPALCCRAQVSLLWKPGRRFDDTHDCELVPTHKKLNTKCLCFGSSA